MFCPKGSLIVRIFRVGRSGTGWALYCASMTVPRRAIPALELRVRCQLLPSALLMLTALPASQRGKNLVNAVNLSPRFGRLNLPQRAQAPFDARRAREDLSSCRGRGLRLILQGKVSTARSVRCQSGSECRKLEVLYQLVFGNRTPASLSTRPIAVAAKLPPGSAAPAGRHHFSSSARRVKRTRPSDAAARRPSLRASRRPRCRSASNLCKPDPGRRTHHLHLVPVGHSDIAMSGASAIGSAVIPRLPVATPP
jgi:hypothetical protein